MLNRFRAAYIWDTAVIACCDFGLVGVDEDLRVASRAAAAITGHDAVMRPSDRLLVNHFHSRERLGLPEG